MRTAASNCIDIFNLIREIRSVSRLNEMVLFHQIDGCPNEKLKIELLLFLTKLTPLQLYAMTYVPLYQKFVDTSEEKNFANLLSRRLEVQYRRFCPACLGEYSNQGVRGVFELYWQISDITHCHIHNIPLTNKCPKCGINQSYISATLGDYVCFKCGEELTGEKDFETEIISNACNNKRFEIWNYLLNSETKGLTRVPGLKYEVQMAITLLYLLDKKNKKGRADIAPVMNKDERRKALLFIKNRDTDLFVTPYRLSTLLVRVGASAEEFFNIVVPNDFIEFIAKRLNIDNEKLAQLEAKKLKKQTIQHRREPDHVKKVVLDFLRQRPKDKGSVTNKEVYSNIAVSINSVPYEVKQFVSEAVKEYNRQLKEAIYREIEKNAMELLSSGKQLTYRLLANRVGVHVMFIKRDKEIIRRINKIKCIFA